MNKILFIINGESFKSGGSNSRDRGTNDLYNRQQKIECESHIRLFEYIEKKLKCRCDVFINSYETNGFEKDLLSWYGDRVIYSNFNTNNFSDEFGFIENTISHLKKVNLEFYDYCFFIRPDLYIKNYFKTKLKFDNKVRYTYVDSNPISNYYSSYFTHYVCFLHSITLVPKIYFDYIFQKKVWYWHSSASEFVKTLGVDKNMVNKIVDLFVDTVHWSSTDIEWNPIFTQCGRENKLRYE